MLSVDARRAKGVSTASGFEVTTHGGRQGTGIDAIEWVERAQELGAGEILLNSMDADGTRDGFDLPMIAAVRAAHPPPAGRQRRGGHTGALLRRPCAPGPTRCWPRASFTSATSRSREVKDRAAVQRALRPLGGAASTVRPTRQLRPANGVPLPARDGLIVAVDVDARPGRAGRGRTGRARRGDPVKVTVAGSSVLPTEIAPRSGAVEADRDRGPADVDAHAARGQVLPERRAGRLRQRPRAATGRRPVGRPRGGRRTRRCWPRRRRRAVAWARSAADRAGSARPVRRRAAEPSRCLLARGPRRPGVERTMPSGRTGGPRARRGARPGRGCSSVRTAWVRLGRPRRAGRPARARSRAAEWSGAWPAERGVSDIPPAVTAAGRQRQLRRTDGRMGGHVQTLDLDPAIAARLKRDEHGLCRRGRAAVRHR